MISMGTHVGTHVDALAHVSQDGQLYGGLDADEALEGGRYVELGAHTIEPMVRRGVLLDVPGDARRRPARRRLRDHRRRPRGRPSQRQGIVDRRRRRRPGPQRLGPALRRRRRRHVPRPRDRRARRRRGRRDLAGRARRARRRRRHHRLRAARSRRRARPAAGAPGAAGRARHLHHRDDGPRGAGRATAIHEFLLRARRRCRSSAPPGRRSARWRWSAHDADAEPTLGAAARRVRRPRREGRRARTTSRAASSSASSTSLGLVRRRAPAADQRRRRSATSSTRAAHPQATAVGVPDRVTAAQAAFVNGVLAHSLDYDDTHLPSVLHPSASVVPAALAAGRARRRRPASRRRPRDRGRPRGRRTARHGRLRRASSATRSSSSTASTPPRSPARWAARSPPRCCTAPTRPASLDALGLTASMASGIIEANRTGGTVKRLHCGCAAQAGVTAAQLVAPRLHRTADRAGGPVRLLRGLAARAVRPRPRSPTASATDWAVPGIFFKPYPANHFTHAGVDAGLAFRGPRRPARRRRVDHGRRRRRAVIRTIGEPIEVKRAPETGYQAQFSGPYAVAAGLLGGGGPRPRPRRLHRRARPATRRAGR